MSDADGEQSSRRENVRKARIRAALIFLIAAPIFGALMSLIAAATGANERILTFFVLGVGGVVCGVTLLWRVATGRRI